MNSRLIIRRLPADDESVQLSEWVTAEELTTADSFAPQRRREYLTWRAVVRQELGRDVSISYARNGAPTVGCGLHIGVSHSRNLVAVCIGEQPCAVDTEPLGRNFENVRQRYMSGYESALSDDPRLSAAVWCAKETLYKLGGHEGCDFLRDIRITSVDFDKDAICGTIYGGNEIRLAISYMDDNIVVSGECNNF